MTEPTRPIQGERAVLQIEQQAVLVEVAALLEGEGRAGEAAEAWLAAAEIARACHPALWAAAALDLLRSGQVERGRALLRATLADLHLHPPRGRAAVRLWAGWCRARLWWRGSRVRPRVEPEGYPAAAEHRALDALSVVAREVGTQDRALAAGLAAELTRRALDLGSRRHLVEAACLEACLRVAAGPRAWPRVRRVLDGAGALACAPGERLAVAPARAHAHLGLGRFAESLRLARRGVALAAPLPSEEATALRLVEADALFALGRLAPGAELVRGGLAQARSRGDLHAERRWRAVGLPPELLDHQAEAARAALDRLCPACARARLQQAQVALYEGRPARARDLLEAARADLARGGPDFAGRVRLVELEGRVALALGRTCAARRAARWLGRAGTPWTEALSALLAAQAEGGRDPLEQLRAAGLRLHAQAWIGDYDGIAAMGVRRPDLLVNLVVPRRGPKLSRQPALAR